MPEQVRKVQVRATAARAIEQRLALCDFDSDLPVTAAELAAIERLLGDNLLHLLIS
jgi:hypothetical protein